MDGTLFSIMQPTQALPTGLWPGGSFFTQAPNLAIPGTSCNDQLLNMFPNVISNPAYSGGLHDANLIFGNLYNTHMALQAAPNTYNAAEVSPSETF